MTKDEALKMAIEALESFEIVYGDTDLLMPHNFYKTLNACKEALALSEKQHTFPDKKQPAQGSEQAPCEQPVAWLYKRENSSGGWYVVTNYDKEHDNGNRNIECYDIPLYTPLHYHGKETKNLLD